MQTTVAVQGICPERLSHLLRLKPFVLELEKEVAFRIGKQAVFLRLLEESFQRGDVLEAGIWRSWNVN